MSGENRKFSVEAHWYSPHQIVGSVNGEDFILGRVQVGILFLFSIASEVSRAEIYEYCYKIDPATARVAVKTSVARAIRYLKAYGFLVEHKKLFYRTMLGQAVWMVIHSILDKRPEPKQ